MIDLHTHTFFSDGVLCPSELVLRALNRGYKVIAITDHCDASNLEFVLSNLKKAVMELNEALKEIASLVIDLLA